MTATLLHPPVVDDATRRQFLTLLGAAGLLTGCTATPTSPTTETRTVTGMFGPVDLPVDPQRVVATYDDTLAHALALGLPVVAAPGARGSTGSFPSFLPPDLVAGIERFAAIPELDVEAIAAARPDAILDTFNGGEFSSTLSGIAPTFVPPVRYTGANWTEIMLAIGDAFGRGDRARQLLAERDAALDELAREVAAGPFAGATYTMLAADEDGGAFVYGRTAVINGVLIAIGLRPSPFVESIPVDTYTVTVAAENLDQIDADLLIVSGEPVPDTEEIDLSSQPIRDQPTWQALSAVQAGNVIDFLNIQQGSVYAEVALRDFLRSQFT